MDRAEQLKAAYQAMPEQSRDLCADRENALDSGHAEGSEAWWSVMLSSAICRRDEAQS